MGHFNSITPFLKLEQYYHLVANHINCIIVTNTSPPLQELVDVYTEFPFFVRGRGWSSCCPQRTARLCGLQCRQLSVGDICLVLTPLPPHSTPHPPPLPPSTNLRADTSTRGAEGGCGTLRPPCPKTALPTQLPPATESQKKEVEPARRRHWSAPEFRGPRINSPY